MQKLAFQKHKNNIRNNKFKPKTNKWYANRIGPTCNWRDWTGKFAKSGEKFGFFGEMR